MTYAFDPELAAAVTFLPDVDLTEIAAVRSTLDEMISSLVTPDLAGLDVTDELLPASDGHEVSVRVFRPESSNGVPALLYIHGGGFVVGGVDTEAAGSAVLARELGVVVVSVEYRLAPEHPYPAAVDDCMTALCWMHDQAGGLGIDSTRIGVLGQSAGGGLAAAVALRARDEGGPPLCFQFLGIPELDDRLDTPSMRRFVDTPMWNRPSAVLSWQYYLDGLEGDIPCYAAPARAEDLAGLPTAYVSAMEFDPLRDEAIVYASRMLQAGVSVELHVYPGTFHGSSAIPHAAVSQRIHSEMFEAVRRGLGLGVTNS
jgi:acetyl esterase/lipase